MKEEGRKVSLTFLKALTQIVVKKGTGAREWRMDREEEEKRGVGLLCALEVNA